MMRLLKMITGLSLMLALLSGCANSGNPPDQLQRVLEVMELEQGEAVRSISNFRLNGWRYIDRNILIVTSGMHDHYLFDLAGNCSNLPFAFRIGFDSRGGSISRFDALLVYSLHGQAQRCTIQQIYRLDDIE